MGSTTQIIINADDYGISPGTSRSILNLLETEKIHATSVMTASPHWKNWGTAISDHFDTADIGLHFTLTEFTTLAENRVFGNGNFASLLARSYSGRISHNDVTSEFFRQWDNFVRVVGRPPSHIDSHQHIHQLPGVLGPLLSAIKEVGGSSPPYVRTCNEKADTIWKRGVSSSRAGLFALAGHRLEKLARKNGLRVNNGFSGIYDFETTRDYGKLMSCFLKLVSANTILLCHPGQDDADYPHDPIASARKAEYKFFLSPQFSQMLNEHKVRSGRFV
jgi:chitin disaccharide deacetylase